MDILSQIKDDCPFHIFQEDCGNTLKINIPGQSSFPTMCVHWDKSMLKDHFIIPPQHRLTLAQDCAKKGLLPDLTPKEVQKIASTSDTHCVNHPWNMDSTNPDNWRVFERVAYWNLVERLWRPLCFILKDSVPHYDYVEYDHPILPQMVSTSFVESWYQRNQKEGVFILKRQQSTQKTTIDSVEKTNEIVLKIKNHGFEHHPYQRVRLYPLPEIQAGDLSEDELSLLKKQVLKRDSYLLQGLSNSERKQLSRHQDCPTSQSLSLHWIQWLHLGGTQDKSNALVITDDTAFKYRISVQRPFDIFWRQNAPELKQSGKRIFVDLPIPMTAYRSKTLKSQHLDPEKRRFINRQERHHLNQQARLAGLEYGD